MLPLALGAGCIGNRVVYPVMPDAEELAEFTAAGPEEASAGVEELRAVHLGGPYRIVPGDLLQIDLPAEVEGRLDEDTPPRVEQKTRVTPAGTIRLPMIGEVSVAGKTASEIEDGIASAYHAPERLKERPNVVVTVGEYRTVSVAVVGAVNAPGIHELRSDRLSVLGALMAAGGIAPERGATRIRVLRTDAQGRAEKQVLSVRMQDIPLADVSLAGGETLVVEPSADRQFAVIGLVRKAGVFPYPEPRRFNLMQALAVAGGVDENAAPRFATVYRQTQDGQIIGATFKIDGTSLTDASNVWIKNGDVIAVEHTQGSWMRQFLSQVLGFRASFSVSGASSATL